MSDAIVMRPKSIATVVPDLPSTGAAMSMPRLSTVICASVRSGSISEIAPTKVVLPTANPPATTIFIATGTDRGCAAAPNPVARPNPDCWSRSESTDSIEQPLEDRDVVRRVRWVHVHRDGANRDEITDKHAGHSEREGE